MSSAGFVEAWRRQKSRSFDLVANSTGGRTVWVDLWGRPTPIYSNANLSIYSAQACNAKCPFCVEELRPASRGRELMEHRKIERDDEVYFSRLNQVLSALVPLNPSVSITGGEPSKDPRLPRILRLLQGHGCRKRTITTNGSGLLDEREGSPLVDWIVSSGVKHLNISRAHIDQKRNAAVMVLKESLSDDEMCEVVRRAFRGGSRPRLSCVLLEGQIDSLEGIVDYLEYARSLGVDNVIFRQLMKTDPNTMLRNHVVLYSDVKRVLLEGILDEISSDPRFSFQKQIMGYYYYVEVWRYFGIDVVFEEADLAQLEVAKRSNRDVCHELVFHPNGVLASTWQPWDGVLYPVGTNRQRVNS